MATEDYEIVDVGRVRTVLADATLAASLGAIFTWAGFFGPGEEVPATMQQPIHVDDGKPRGCGIWALGYRQDPSDALNGDKLSRFAELRVHLRRQPDPSLTYLDHIMTAKAAVANRFRTLSTTNMRPLASRPLFPAGVVDGWQEMGFFQPLWMK